MPLLSRRTVAKSHSQTTKRRVRGCFKKRDKRRLDEVGVIHMNGRIYDPLIGRFMSADPFIQAPYELQSHNRYAYVMNNPLGQGASDSVTSISRQPYVSTAVAIGVAIYTGSPSGLGWSATAAGAAGAAAGAMTAGGNATQIVKAAAIGGLTAWGFEWAGTTGGTGKVGATSYTRYAAHAAVGCASSVASGGQCRQGAAAAVLGKWVTNHTPQDWSVAARGVAATAAGGVGSVIGGGKFENGAVTAAYGYLFNQVMSEREKQARASSAQLNEKLREFVSEGLKKSPENEAIARETMKTLIVIAIPPLAVPSMVIDGIVVINDLYNNDRGEAGKGALSISVGAMTEGGLNANGARPSVSNRVGTGLGYLWDQFVKLF